MTDHGDRPRRQTTESRILAFSRESYRRFEYLKARDDFSEAAQKAAGAVLHGQGFRRIFGGRRKILEEEKHLAILQTRHLVPESAPKLAFSGAAASEVERMQSGASLTH